MILSVRHVRGEGHLQLQHSAGHQDLRQLRHSAGHSGHWAQRLMKSYLSKLEGKYWLPALHHPQDKLLTQYRVQIYLPLKNVTPLPVKIRNYWEGLLGLWLLDCFLRLSMFLFLAANTTPRCNCLVFTLHIVCSCGRRYSPCTQTATVAGGEDTLLPCWY